MKQSIENLSIDNGDGNKNVTVKKKRLCFINSDGTEHSQLKCQRLTQADKDKDYDCSYSLLNHANIPGCKENHFYSLPFGQAVATIY